MYTNSIFWIAILRFTIGGFTIGGFTIGGFTIGGMTIGVTLSADDSTALATSGGTVLAQDPVVFRESELTESSGLAFSRRSDRRLWTHNDSGGLPRLYCFDTSGRKTGSCDLDVPAVDWEDIAAYSDHGVARLLVADSGDNGSTRHSITLHLFDEPDPDRVTQLDRVQSIIVSYPGGLGDCEAVAVDQQHRMIVLIAKTVLSPATVYTLPLPRRISDNHAESEWSTKVTAKKIRRLVLPLVTGMDFNSATGDLWVTSYFNAYRFQFSKADPSVGSAKPSAGVAERSIATLLNQIYQSYPLPKWKQIEAIAIDSQNNVWVTTEGVPARLGQLSLKEFHTPSLGVQN